MRRLLSPLVLLCSGLFACSGGPSTDGNSASTTSRFQTAGGDQFTAYSDPYGDGRPNPIADIAGNVEVLTITDQDAKDYGLEASTQVWMSIWGAEKGVTYPAHVHQKACASADKAGGHYQNVPGGPADATNEVHLDVTSNLGGSGFVSVRVPFAVRSGEANSIVLHDGLAVAGKYPKLACVDVAF